MEELDSNMEVDVDGNFLKDCHIREYTRDIVQLIEFNKVREKYLLY